jgi:hypothetical protein
MRFGLAMVLLLSALAFGKAQTIGFNNTPVGGFPEGWDAYMTHSGGAPRWQVIQDAATPGKPRALAQLSDDATRSRFPLAIFREASIQNGTISVSFKAISGKIDQGAGLVWRFVDVDNYYIVRANALEDNVVLYKVEKGTRTALAPKGTPPGTYGISHKVAPQEWNRLSVSFHGDSFTVNFNGEKLFEVEDGTYTGEGKTGLWTKADSVIYFRDFEIKNDGASSGH